jgi:hypothetical protein
MADLKSLILTRCNEVIKFFMNHIQSKYSISNQDLQAMLLRSLVIFNSVTAQKIRSNNKITKKQLAEEEKTAILRKIATREPIQISKNNFGKWEHPDTGLIFDDNTKVVGRQLEDGSVAKLTESDIDMCKKYCFEFDSRFMV